MDRPLHMLSRLGCCDASLVRHRGWEMLIMRIALAALVFLETDWILKEYYQAAPTKPEGLAHLPGAEFFAQPSVGAFLKWLGLAGLVLFAVGFAPVLTLFPALFGNIMIGSLVNSQGRIGHSGQLLSLVLLAAWFVYLYLALRRVPPPAAEASASRSRWWAPGPWGHRLAIHWIKITIAASYVVSALQKWLDSDFQWIWRTPWLAVQMVKNNRADYFSTLERSTGWMTTDLPRLILDHPNLARVVFGSGLLLETLAFLALAGRRWSLAIGLALIGLHLSISVVMNLHFEIHMWIIAIFFVNLPGIWFLFRETDSHRPLSERSLVPAKARSTS